MQEDTMGIFQRVSDILSANLHEMLDRHEHPEKLLKQAVSEMDDAIGLARREVAKAMANEALAAKDLAASEARVEQWCKRATMAIEAGDDGLARKALLRKKEYEQVVQLLKQQVDDSASANKQLRESLAEMEAKLSEARLQLGALTARQKAAILRANMAANVAVRDVALNQRTFDKFERFSRKVQLAEAEADALAELESCGQTEADEWSDGFSLDEELERLREQCDK